MKTLLRGTFLVILALGLVSCGGSGGNSSGGSGDSGTGSYGVFNQQDIGAIFAAKSFAEGTQVGMPVTFYDHVYNQTVSGVVRYVDNDTFETSDGSYMTRGDSYYNRIFGTSANSQIQVTGATIDTSSGQVAGYYVQTNGGTSFVVSADLPMVANPIAVIKNSGVDASTVQVGNISLYSVTISGVSGLQTLQL